MDRLPLVSSIHDKQLAPMPATMPPYTIEIADRQACLPIDAGRIRSAVEGVLRGEGIESAEISIAFVDDETIHDLNRRYLNHDDPTDVISFPLGDGDDVDGEIVVSTETAIRQADTLGHAAIDEVLLYVVHGVLHLVGYDDLAPDDAAEMRRREARYVDRAGRSP